MHPTNPRAYVATGAPFSGSGGNSVAVINTDTLAVTNNVGVGGAPYGVTVHPLGTSAYVTNSTGNSVSVIDLATHTVSATIPVGTEPRGHGKFIATVTKPGVPRSVVAAGGDGKITMTFSPPLFDGGSPIIQYDATCGSTTASGVGSPIVVNGLTNGTSYSCTVKAWTANGAGPTSAAVSSSPLAGTLITSANAATVPVFSALNFTVQAIGSVTSFTYTGTLPTGVTLSSSGVLSGTPATGTAGTYPIVITANGASPAGTQNFTLTVTKLAQTVSFTPLNHRSIASPPFTVSATGGASGNPVTFFSSTTGICTTSGTNGATVTPVVPGNCTINATQAGNADYNEPVNLASRSFSYRALQSITINPPPPLVAGATITLSGTGGGSGKPVWFWTATPATCTVAGQYGTGNQLTGVGVGTCTILANQNGDTYYHEPAPQVSLDITVGRGPQVIVTSTLALPIGVSSQRIVSSGGSGNPVVVTSETPSICTTDGTRITALELGLCKIVANQDGNLNYFPAAATSFSLPTYSAMSSIRAWHASAPLADGRVLVAGGVNATTTLTTADI
jgi:YVTN family beta-propeller protein